jgi:hypothetical protein
LMGEIRPRVARRRRNQGLASLRLRHERGWEGGRSAAQGKMASDTNLLWCCYDLEGKGRTGCTGEGRGSGRKAVHPRPGKSLSDSCLSKLIHLPSLYREGPTNRLPMPTKLYSRPLAVPYITIDKNCTHPCRKHYYFPT